MKPKPTKTEEERIFIVLLIGALFIFMMGSGYIEEKEECVLWGYKIFHNLEQGTILNATLGIYYINGAGNSSLVEVGIV